MRAAADDRSFGPESAAYLRGASDRNLARVDSCRLHSLPGTPGFELKDAVTGGADLRIVKTVHSSFHGDVDLDAWLREHGIGAIAICGIQTNFCCETTARIGCDLGYDVWFVLDATHTFDDKAPDGEVVPAAEIARMTGINLQDEFAEVVTTAAACT